MDPTWAKRLVDRVCDELAEKRRKTNKILKPLGLSVALGLGVGVTIACPVDLYAAPVYGAPYEDVIDDDGSSNGDTADEEISSTADILDDEIAPDAETE